MHAAPNKSEAEKRQSLAKIVKAAHTAFFVTEAGGLLHGRPMSNAEVDADLQAVWFASRRDSGKIAELRQDQHVLLGYMSGGGSDWASVYGTAALVEDRAKIKELWSPLWSNWFDGPDDPKIVLIRVTPTSAEYWDSDSKALLMIKFALAAVTGKKFDEGENEHLKL